MIIPKSIFAISEAISKDPMRFNLTGVHVSRPKGKTMIYIQLAATNDENGNPRRVFVLFDEKGNIREVKDEGYGGDPYVNSGHSFGGRFATTATERRELLKQYVKNGGK